MLTGLNLERVFLGLAILAFAAAAFFFFKPDGQKENRVMTDPAKPLSTDSELATLGGGCFWCLEAVYEQVKGVERVESGYTGGPVKDPTYRQVCNGDTGHAEVVQVAFDPKVISYREILQIFFVIHDPTTLNRQGADIGTQYRSAIYFHSPQQKETAEKLIAEFTAEKVFPRPIVTEVTPLETFYRAEEYHQGYYRNNPNAGYCQAVVAPKVSKLRKQFLSKLKTP
jgi:peptide-methionine (S)-S-oxide reductase